MSYARVTHIVASIMSSFGGREASDTDPADVTLFLDVCAAECSSILGKGHHPEHPEMYHYPVDEYGQYEDDDTEYEASEYPSSDDEDDDDEEEEEEVEEGEDDEGDGEGEEAEEKEYGGYRGVLKDESEEEYYTDDESDDGYYSDEDFDDGFDNWLRSQGR